MFDCNLFIQRHLFKYRFRYGFSKLDSTSAASLCTNWYLVIWQFIYTRLFPESPPTTTPPSSICDRNGTALLQWRWPSARLFCPWGRKCTIQIWKDVIFSLCNKEKRNHLQEPSWSCKMWSPRSLIYFLTGNISSFYHWYQPFAWVWSENGW